MTIVRIGTYEPVWDTGRGRTGGADEDVVTLAVAAAETILDDTSRIGRVVIVTRTPDVLDGVGLRVVSRALGLGADVPVELRVGGAPATLDALLSQPAGTVVIGVDIDDPGTQSAAALIGAEGEGLGLGAAQRSLGSLPMRVRHVGLPAAAVYNDGRVERELATAPLLTSLGSSDGPTYVAGLASRDAERLGAQPSSSPTAGAASALAMLAQLADAGSAARLVALDTATAVGVDVVPGGSVTVRRESREAIAAQQRPVMKVAADIPFSMPAYARAFDAKVGLTAAQCECGTISYPPRLVCLECDRYDATHPVDLPRTGEVYSTVMIHTPVPGVAGPYAVAIVSLDDSPVRVLAQVADAVAPGTDIGDRGRLVLRLVATREGVPDYGYAFQAGARSEITA